MDKDRIPRKLRVKAIELSALGCGIFLVLSLGLGFSLPRSCSLPQVLLPLICLAYVLVLLWRLLPWNHRPGEEGVLLGLGPGTWVTVIRGVFISVLAGVPLGHTMFFGGERGWAAWVPGSIYLAAVFGDLADGGLARLRNHVTCLGEVLDMKMDALGLLVAPAVAISMDRLPLPYILVGLAHYLFNTGIWIRKRVGKKTAEWVPTRMSRFLAGSQMGFVGTALLPVFSPEVVKIVSWLFMLPFLGGFLKDWLGVCGRRPSVGGLRIGIRGLSIRSLGTRSGERA